MNKIKQEVEQQIKTDYQQEQEAKHKEYVEHTLQYAVKNGFISEDCESWTQEQKEKYVRDCEAYEPEQDFTGASDDQGYPDR